MTLAVCLPSCDSFSSLESLFSNKALPHGFDIRAWKVLQRVGFVVWVVTWWWTSRQTISLTLRSPFFVTLWSCMMGRKDCKLPDVQSIEMGFSSFFFFLKKINQLPHFFEGFFFCIFCLIIFLLSVFIFICFYFALFCLRENEIRVGSKVGMVWEGLGETWSKCMNIF